MNVTIILVFWMVFRFPYIFKPMNKTDEKNHFQFRNRQFIQHLFMNTIFLWYENVWTFMGVNYVAFEAFEANDLSKAYFELYVPII